MRNTSRAVSLLPAKCSGETAGPTARNAPHPPPLELGHRNQEVYVDVKLLAVSVYDL
jgi:hypothetical protein